MQNIFLVAIVVLGALGFAKRIAAKTATWLVIALTVLGIFITPDIPTRIAFVIAALLGPVVPYALAVLWALTVRPLFHYLRFRVDAHRTLFLVTPDDPRYAEASRQLDEQVREAVSLGFVSHGRIGLTVGRLTAVNEYLERDGGRQWVIVNATLGGAPVPVTIHCSSMLSSGEFLVVSNTGYVEPNPPTRGFVYWRLPGIRRIADLVRASDHIAGKSGPVIPMPLDTDLLTRAKTRTRLRLEAERERGLQRYDAANDTYRPTLSGAYRHFWVSLPPLNWIIDRRERARERELLREMGLTASSTAAAGTPEPTRRHYWEAAGAVVVIMLLAVVVPELLSAVDSSTARLRPIPRVDVPANLSVPNSFPDAVRTLEQLVGQPSHQLSGTRDDEPAPTRGVAISMRMDSAEAFVAAAQEAFYSSGFYLFRTGERYSGLDTDGLALYPSTDPYEIMRAMDTNGANHGYLVEDVIQWFRREEARYPVRFTAIVFHYAAGRLLGDFPDGADYARRFIRFCPDIMAEGSVTVRQLAKDFQKSREVFCWWD